MKPRIVVSAVNVVEMGPLSIMNDALEVLAAVYSPAYEIVAVVHQRCLFTVPHVTYLEFPAVKRSWLRRLKFEYHDLKNLSRELKPDLWLSMHDITPSVVAKSQAVYCHNASPFYPFHKAAPFVDWKFAMFTLLYRFVYRVHIHRNDYVIVQQNWMREAFRQLYGIENVIVAHPDASRMSRAGRDVAQYFPGSRRCRFMYPCFPRVFKNVEVVLEAVRLLAERGHEDFTLCLTFNGTESRYSENLVTRYQTFKQIQFLGLLPRDAVLDRYGETDCLVFASKLESWGMPITEYKPFRRPILVADLPYAHETTGDHEAAAFFAPDDPACLAELMEAVIEGRFGSRPVKAAPIAAPYCQSWKQLFERIVPPITGA